jgi:hypothetical protein
LQLLLTDVRHKYLTVITVHEYLSNQLMWLIPIKPLDVQLRGCLQQYAVAIDVET